MTNQRAGRSGLAGCAACPCVWQPLVCTHCCAALIPVGLCTWWRLSGANTCFMSSHRMLEEVC